MGEQSIAILAGAVEVTRAGRVFCFQSTVHQEASGKLPEQVAARDPAVISEVVRVVTLGDFRKAVAEEAVALLCLLRQARRTAEHDPLEAIRTIAPTLERLGRIAETAFEPVPPEYGFGGTRGLIHPSLFLCEGLPPRAVPRKSEQSAAETNGATQGM